MITEIIVLAQFIAVQAGLVFLLKKTKGLVLKVDNISTWITALKYAYIQFDKIALLFDKDPDTDSVYEKIIKYLGIVIDSFDEQIFLATKQYETDDEKKAQIRQYVIDKLHVIIVEYEGPGSEAMDPEKIEKVVDEFLKILFSLIKFDDFGQ